MNNFPQAERLYHTLPGAALCSICGGDIDVVWRHGKYICDDCLDVLVDERQEVYDETSAMA